MTRYYKSSGKKSVKRRPPIPNPTNLHDHTNYKMAALLVSAAAFAYALTLIFLSISSNSLGLEPSIDRIYDVQVVNEFPHDPDAFTQVFRLDFLLLFFINPQPKIHLFMCLFIGFNNFASTLFSDNYSSICTNSFGVQGLLYAGNDALFESTGLYGHVSVFFLCVSINLICICKSLQHVWYLERVVE